MCGGSGGGGKPGRTGGGGPDMTNEGFSAPLSKESQSRIETQMGAYERDRQGRNYPEPTKYREPNKKQEETDRKKVLSMLGL